MSEWIKCSDRLPDDGVWVLIYQEGYVFDMASYSERNDLFENGYEWLEGVTHWMPLPEPPK